jgi:PPM family protein phosphatase
MIEAFGASDPGCVRANNEDYYLLEPSLGLYVVADGMGGAQAGEHASRLAVETVREIIRNNSGNSGGTDPDQLVDAFVQANQRVMQAAEGDPAMEGMGTTLVAALEQGGHLMVASVGDSRAYLFEQGRLQQVTEDQTWVNEVGRRLGLDEAMLKNHPMRHVLTMAVGVSDQLRVHHYQVQPSPGVQLLLCTDGLHGVTSEKQIEQTLASHDSLEAKCRQLIASARAEGGPDNVTAVLLRTS